MKSTIALDDLKAQAQMHDIRVTASTVTAARRLLAPTTATSGSAADPAQIRCRPHRGARGDVAPLKTRWTSSP